MNFIFISPCFPPNYYQFPRAMKGNGVRTLGIAEDSYDSLAPELKEALDDYLQVDNLEDYDQVYRTVATFAARYGKIDWLESNNEYWLEQDSRLRTDFNITTGAKYEDLAHFKYKSGMKACYELAGCPTARYRLCTGLEDSLDFCHEVGYPVIVKPDNGVGAAATYRLDSDDEVRYFYDTKPDVLYIMEEFINGHIVSYDGICDSEGNIVFETSHDFPEPIMDIVNEQLDVIYHSVREIPADLYEIGRKVVKAFRTKSRFFHCEYFRLLEDKKGLGKKGDIVGLEVNMRPPGGFTPDMMNFANDIDVYQIYADMVCSNRGFFDPQQRPYFCAYAGRRDGKNYLHSHEEIIERYGDKICLAQRNPELFAQAMANFFYIARFENEAEIDEFNHFVLDIA